MKRAAPDEALERPADGARSIGFQHNNSFKYRKGEAHLSFSSLYDQLHSHCKAFSTPMSLDGLLSMIKASGICQADPRIVHTIEKVKQLQVDKAGDELLTQDEFESVVKPDLRMMLKILNYELAIPDFHGFTNDLTALYHLVEGDTSGSNADYIPILRDADPDRWGVSVCTTDGQRFDIGDVDDYFSIQSTSKVVTFATALSEIGEKETLSYVGVEPSGQAFNAIVCLPDQRPHNPCVNVGAIMTCAVLASGSPKRSAAEHTQHVMSKWAALSGHTDEIKFSEETMQSEKGTGFNNYSLCYFAKARRGLPEDFDVDTVMDFYLSCCSIQATCKIMAAVAGTLANGGVCPMTGEEVFTADVVKRTLAVMQSCGMYDASGVFLYEIGLPAKSGVSGIVISVVPNVMGLATFSPRLDKFGNSVRGVRFNQLLTECFSFHSFDNMSALNSGCKKDPRLSQSSQRETEIRNLRFAIQHGDVEAVEFRYLLLQAMVATAMADGHMSDAEHATVGDVYQELMRCNVNSAELSRVVGEMQKAGLQSFVDGLKADSSDLDDIQRDILIQATFKVAAADGMIKSEEIDVLAQVASGLRIPAVVVELRVFEWREELASKGCPVKRLAPQVARAVAGSVEQSSDSTDVDIERLAIEEGLDAPDGPRSQLHAADAVSRTTIRPTSGANRAAAPPRLGRSGK